MPEPKSNPPFAAQSVSDLSGGMDERQEAWLIKENAATLLENVDVSKIGRWDRRKGCTPKGGWLNTPAGLGTFKENSTGERVAWAIFGSRLFASDGSPLWEQKACSASLVGDRIHMFVEGNWVGAGGDQRALYMSVAAMASGLTLASGITAFKGLNAVDYSQTFSLSPMCIQYAQNRLWAANDQIDGDGNDLAWSELDDGLTYSPANELSIEPGVGGRITAVLGSRDSTQRLVIFKENAIIEFTPRWGSSGAIIPGTGDELDTINSNVRLLTGGVGCVATRSVVYVPGLENRDVLFLARDGVRSLQRAENDVQIGAGLPLTYSIPDVIDRINWAEAHKACAELYDNAYWLAVPLDGNSDNSHVLRYDLFTESWSLHTIQVRDLRQIPFNESPALWFQNNFATTDCSATGAAESGTYQVYRFLEGTEDPGGSPVPYTVQTRAFHFGDLNIRKQWKELSIFATVEDNSTHVMTLVYRVDKKDWTTIASGVIFSSVDTGVNLGVDALPWTVPEKQAVRRRVGLMDVGPGYFIEFKIMDDTDFGRPAVYDLRLTAEAEQEIFDNDNL